MISSSNSKIFLSNLSLPVALIMARSAVACATQVAEMLSFSEKNKYYLEVAVEEAFTNAVKYYSNVDNSEERIYVEFYIEGDSLIVSVREKGIPFDLKQSKRYTPDTLDGMDAPGLGMLLMSKGMDSVELFIHGREGKEVKLTKKLEYGSIPQELLFYNTKIEGTKRTLVKNAILRLAELDDLQEITRLAWRCYGYTQENLLYDLELLTKKYLSGEFKPLVAFEPENGNMIGHVGLKYHDLKIKVPEIGFAFIDPRYRCPGLSAEMGRSILNVSREGGDLGVFDSSVTTHTASQRAMQDYVGSRPCSLMMGIAAHGMQVKGRHVVKQEKGSVINHYYAFDRTEKTVYPLPRHRDMISEIYNWLQLPREFGDLYMKPPKGESLVSLFNLPDELNVSFIIVHKIGQDTLKEVIDGINKCKYERKNAVYAFIPLGVKTSAYLVEQCEKIGLSFAGIMPHIHNGDDRILLQSINIPLDFKKIRVYGEKSAKLFSYIMSEKERLEKLE